MTNHQLGTRPSPNHATGSFNLLGHWRRKASYGYWDQLSAPVRGPYLISTGNVVMRLQEGKSTLRATVPCVGDSEHLKADEFLRCPLVSIRNSKINQIPLPPSKHLLLVLPVSTQSKSMGAGGCHVTPRPTPQLQSFPRSSLLARSTSSNSPSTRPYIYLIYYG